MNIEKQELSNIQKKAVLTYLYQEGNSQKGLHLAAVASTLKNRLGIDWREYADDVAGGFAHWFCQHFPTELVREEKDGVELSKLRLLFPTIPEYCADIVMKAMGKNKRILKAQIPGILESKGIKWQEHANGKKLGDWLTDSFAQFKDSEDNYSVCLRGAVPEVEEDEEEEYDYPLSLDVSSEDLEEEIRQMHSFAFMGWWSNNARRLRQYTGYKGNDEGIWRAIVAHKMAEAFIGVSSSLLDASGDEEPRIAFDTGMTTLAGEKLYCVFALNPKNVNGTMQPWILLGFCYPGEEDENGLGKWLNRRFEVTSGNSIVPENDYLLLKEKLEELQSVQDSLLSPMTYSMQDVADGCPLCRPEIAEELVKYQSLWAEVDKLLVSMGWSMDNEDKNISGLLEKIRNYDTEAEQLNKIVQTFIAMAEGVQSLFEEYHISTGQNAVTQTDIQRIKEMYGGTVVFDQNKAFLEILAYYKALHQVMAAPALTEEVGVAIEKVCQHFTGVTYKTASKLLVNSEPQECEIFTQISSIERDLKSRNASATRTEGREQREITAKELLDAATLKDYEKDWNVHTLQIETKDSLEKQIIGNWSDEANKLSKAYTHYAAGMRLYTAIGNQNRTAEKFFLLGLCRRDYRCVTALLDLYREEKQEELFGRIWEAYEKYAEENLQNQIYMLDIKGRISLKKMQEYLDKRPYLLYIKETLPGIIRAYKEQGVFEYAQKLENRLARLQDRQEMNAFEQAVVSGEKERINEWIENKDKLEALEYTDREIRQIVQIAAGENYSKGMQDYEIGVRILAFQGNKNDLAEQYLWRGLSTGNRTGCGVELMGILVSGQRWEECAVFYEAYREELSTEGKSRQYYLLALLHINPKSAVDFIRDNLQDYLILEQGAAEVKARAEQLAQAEDDTLAGFYRKLLEIGEILSDDFTRSVVLLDRRLRDFVTRQERLLELGIAPELVEKSSALYKTDTYPQGADAVSIAQRVYAFVGTFKGIAEAIAKFALPDYNAASLLWEIYDGLQEEEEQYRLLMDYPMLRENYQEAYAVFLFRKGQYAQFLEVCHNKEEKSELLRIQEFIAYLKTGHEESAILPEIDVDLMQIGAEWVIQLLKELAIAKRLNDIKEILFTYFDSMLFTYATDVLKQAATASGELASEELAEFQKEALAKGCKQIAIYYYNELNIGDVKDVAEEYYQQQMEKCDTSDENDKVVILKSLRALYKGKAEALNGRIALMEISRLLRVGIDLIQDAQQVAAILKGTRLTGEDVTELFGMLNEEAILRNPVVYLELWQQCERTGTEKEGLVFFHRFAMQSKPLEEEFGNFLCKIYVVSLLEDYMPEELLEEAMDLCHTQMKMNRSVMAAFCLYGMERMCGHWHKAEYALRFLADQQVDELGEDFYQIVDNEIKSYWGGNIPGFLELFRTMLNDFETDEIKEYCEYCHDFVGDVQKQLENLKEKSLLSEMESVEALKLLFADSSNPEYWEICTKLPLQNEPVAYARLLYIASTYNPSIWRECAGYCDKHIQKEQAQGILERLLLGALLGWSEDESAVNSREDCRTYLEAHIQKDENYLKRWKESEEAVLRLVSLHCGIELSELHEMERHSALRALIMIAVFSGRPEAMDILYRKQGMYLFGEYSNLSMVAVCHLLLLDRVKEAYELLQKLDKTVSVMKYRVLVDELADMTEEQLGQWMREGREKQDLLRLILPDGNAPELPRIHEHILESIQRNEVETATKVLIRLLKVFPKDYGCYDSLFALCKTEFDGRVACLHKSLCGLISVPLSQSAETYYRRSKQEYAAMLAAVNAVIVSGGLEGEVAGYDFGKKAGDFCRDAMTIGLSYDEVNMLNQLQDDISRLLANRGAEEYAKMSRVIQCHVTGGWSDFLLSAWEKKSDVNEALSLKIEKGTIKVNDNGFARGVIQVYQNLTKEDGRRFIGWLDRELASELCQQSESKHRQMRMVHFVIENELLEKIIDNETVEQILQYPIEEYSLFDDCYKKYIIGALDKGTEEIYARAILIGVLADYYMVQKRFWKTASDHYDDFMDDVASPLFAAMNDLARRFGIRHINKSEFWAKQSALEQYEIYYRLTGLFSGNEEIYQKVSSSEFNSWSCINMAMGLLYTERADEVLKYSQCLAPENRRLIEDLLKGIDEKVSDTEKISIVRSQSDDVVKAILAYIFKYYNNKTGKCFFLKQQENAEILNDIYKDMINKHPECFVKGCFCHFLWVEPMKINRKAYVQAAPEQKRLTEPKREVKEELGEMKIPSFAKDLEPLQEEADLEKLMEEYERMPTFSPEYYQSRAEKAERMYRIMLAGEMSQAEQIDILTRFGVDYYYAHAVGDAAEMRLANQALKELVLLQRHNEEGGKGKDVLEKTVRSTGLHGLLSSPYATLTELIEDYNSYKPAYEQMLRMLTDHVVAENITQIYRVLDELAHCYSTVAEFDTAGRSDGLQNAYTMLNNISNQAWIDVTGELQRLISNEVNALDNRPVLKIEVLNRTPGKEIGNLYGQVRNMGRVAAKNIVLQAHYGTNDNSRRYELKHMAPDDIATFEIDYSVEPGTTVLEYSVAATYNHENNENKQYISAACNGSITIDEEWNPYFPADLYDTDTVADFEADEKGNISSPNFFGRAEETEKLRGLFRGKNFVNYHSTILYGVKRAGKTSLLNYIKKYTEHNCPNAVTICVSCQSIGGNNCIQNIFIDRVFTELKLCYKEITQSDEWSALVEEWTLPEGSEDRDPGELEYFYRQLKSVMGKGLIFLIDEVDTLFERVEARKQLDSTLFPALGTMLCSAECRESVQFILCGSKWLLRYRKQDGALSQLFQRLGDRVTEVGRMPQKDMLEMLLAPYREYPEVTYTEEALNWLWDYTGGLVWYTKLLALAVIRRIREEGRTEIYPSDICAESAGITNDGNCKQFFEGCEEKERLVLDAMQSLAYKQSMYIPASKLYDLLGGYIARQEITRQEIDQALSMLCDLRLLEKHLAGQPKYRFAVELYRKYFRTQEQYESVFKQLPEPERMFRCMDRGSILTGDSDDYGL